MTSKSLVLVLVACGCVAAAGVGGFVAVRVGQGDRAQGAVLTSAPPDDAASTARAAAPAPVVSRPSSPSTPARRPNDDRKTTAAPEAAAPPPVAPPPAATPPPDPPVTEPVVATATVPVTEATVVPDPIMPRFEELTLKEESVIGIRLDSAISTQSAKLEDKVIARVSREVTVNGRTAIPAGARLEGVVTIVDRGGKFKNAAKLGIRFTSLVLADNTRVPIQTEALSREGSSPGNEATAKVGAGAVIGGLIGGLIGGKKGAAVGASAGAAGGSAAVAAGDRNDVTLPAGTALTVKLTAPVTLTIERDER
jgi:hypothetical protein